MGGFFSAPPPLRQVIITGPPSSGKTAFLYSLVLKGKDFKPTVTLGFNYEEYTPPYAVDVASNGASSQTIAIWETGGGQISKTVTVAHIYKSLYISAIIFVVDIEKDDMRLAGRDLNMLLAEEEIRG